MTSLFLFLFLILFFWQSFWQGPGTKVFTGKDKNLLPGEEWEKLSRLLPLARRIVSARETGSSSTTPRSLSILESGTAIVFLFSFYKPKPFVSTGLIWLGNNVIIDRVTITIWMKVTNATSCHDSNNRWSLWDFAARHSVASFPSCRPSCTLAISSSSQRNRLTITTSRWRWKTRPSSPPLPSYWELKRKFCIKRSSRNGPEHPERRSSSTTVCQRYI